MMTDPRPWDRKLWAVAFTGGDRSDPPILIGGLWHKPPVPPSYLGEPTRPLLFCTRAQAREWCGARMAEWQAHPDEILRRWRVRPVRVREVVATC